jgi:tRNA-binding protein
MTIGTISGEQKMEEGSTVQETISWDDFMRVDLRVGTIVAVDDFPEARRPAYKLQVDFGAEIGIKKSSAQITALYERDSLIGKQVLAVVNFPPKQIGPVRSECLVTGFHNADGDIVLTMPTAKVPNGARLL